MFKSITRYVVNSKLFVQELRVIGNDAGTFYVDPVNRYPWIQTCCNMWARKDPNRFSDGNALTRVFQEEILPPGSEIPVPVMRNGYISTDVTFFLEGTAENTFDTAKEMYKKYIRIRSVRLADWITKQQEAAQAALESWVRMERMYESLMEGLMEVLQDVLLYGEPRGRRTVIESAAMKIFEEVQRTGRISKRSCSFSMLKDAPD